VAKEVIRLKALDYAAAIISGGEDFDTAFCRITGYIEGNADGNPDAVYLAKEVAELFDLLFGMWST